MFKKKIGVAWATILMQAFCNTHTDFHMEKIDQSVTLW